ncbi:MAG: peptidoglycan editing factor PgeF [Bacteroidota bacterium]
MSSSTIRYTIPTIFQSFSGLVAAESTRNGGVSPEPYVSLNLGLYTEDDTENVKRNRQLLFNDLGIAEKQIAASYQVHGDEILLVESPGQMHGFDALITDKKGIFLSVKAADCTPILVFDPVKSAVAAIHAGWRGTVKSIALKTILEMQANFGTNPEDCLAYIGTCIDECDFEVDADVADHFSTEFKRWDAQKQKFLVDLKAANRQQLLESGLISTNIEVSSFSTIQHNDRYFSHRKEKGLTGRMLAIIGLEG